MCVTVEVFGTNGCYKPFEPTKTLWNPFAQAKQNTSSRVDPLGSTTATQADANI